MRKPSVSGPVSSLPINEFAVLQLLTGLILLTPGHLNAATQMVGPSGQYNTPCAAISAAASGDIILIDAAGDYTGDVCAIYQDGLTLQGINGRPVINAAGQSAQDKAIWVIVGNDTTVDNIEFTGATVADQNGAGIRQEGRNLTVRRCYFHDNDEGILEGISDPNSQILIEYTEFGFNGYGDGFSHNVYIGHVGSFTLQFSYSHDANVGHLVKSRAAQNYILYNRLTNENGTTSYELDLPNGGQSYVIGNLIEKGPNQQNSNFLAYLEEGFDPSNPFSDLYVVNNSFVNDSGGDATFIYIDSRDPTQAVIRNNIFAGGGTITTQTGNDLAGNFAGDPQFFDPSSYDYHLTMGSPAIDAGTDPGIGGGVSLIPQYEYVHPTCGEVRILTGLTFDAGAYEYLGAGGLLPCFQLPFGVDQPNATKPSRGAPGHP